jgi:DNA repair exonuclease SbcCD ATPase subunit
MVEITYSKHQKELEKLNTQLERAEKAYEKKLEAAKKFGVENWTADDRHEWIQTVPTTQSGFFINKADEKKNGAWWNLITAKSEIEDLTGRIERAEKRLAKSEQEVNAYYEELDKIADLKAKEELMKKQFEQEQKEWKKDGITLESRYLGYTPQGRRFTIHGNNGFTNRSLHCFQLIIDGETIFTSGEFWRAYSEIKRR